MTEWDGSGLHCSINEAHESGKGFYIFPKGVFVLGEALKLPYGMEYHGAPK